MTLETYIDGTYSQVKTQLAWDSGDISMITAKTLQLYGVDTEGDATDQAKLEALCDYAVWKQALADISLDYAFSADNATYNRNQAVDQIRQNMKDAEFKALAYMSEYQAIVHPDATYEAGWEEL